ncbi:hypothetical protein C8R47DRAFT_484800 [Mycena vitilis]|nr:hypothetical protein C8R47DRAFT_484800 [Mycena vitilis]
MLVRYFVLLQWREREFHKLGMDNATALYSREICSKINGALLEKGWTVSGSSNSLSVSGRHRGLSIAASCMNISPMTSRVTRRIGATMNLCSSERRQSSATLHRSRSILRFLDAISSSVSRRRSHTEALSKEVGSAVESMRDWNRDGARAERGGCVLPQSMHWSSAMPSSKYEWWGPDPWKSAAGGARRAHGRLSPRGSRSLNCTHRSTSVIQSRFCVRQHRSSAQTKQEASLSREE